MGLHHLAIAVAQYYAGKKVNAPETVVAQRVAATIKRGGMLSQKFAQLVASRNDVIVDMELLKELRALQSFEEAPDVHVASIASVQVDRAAGLAIKRLRDPSVLQEGPRLRAMLTLARLLARYAPQATIVVDTLETLLQELDLAGELQKNVLFKESLSGSTVTVVPTTLSSSADEVVMEYVPSVLAKDLNGTPADMALVNAFFRDVVIAAVTTGVLHLDLHSGNVGVSTDMEKIVVYDMGSIRRVDTKLTSAACLAMIGAAEHLWLEEWGQLAAYLVGAGIVTSVNDVRNLKIMVEVATAYSDGIADSVDIGNCLREVKGDVTLNGSLFQLVQSMSILEGCCKVLNPQFNMSAAMRDADMATFFMDVLETSVSQAV